MKKLLLAAFLFTSIALFSQTDSTVIKKDTTSSKTLELMIFPRIGAGVVRNSILPTVSGNLMISLNDKYAANFVYSGYFFFNKDVGGKNKMQVNSFVGLELLFKKGLMNDIFFSTENSWGGIGGSLLINRQGNYFNKDNAFKIYYIKMLKHITIMPELIFDDGDVFPGLTIVF